MTTSQRPKRKRLPYAELRARKELAERTLDDIRALMLDADPVNAPADFAAREKKAMALFEDLNSLIPPHDPLSDEERARLEAEMADKPDDETLRKVLLEMEKIVSDPSMPDELREKISKDDIRDALAALDEVALLNPIAKATQALADEMQNPRRMNPADALVRREREKQAAKRRS
jgi:hypothetical protein